MIDGIFAIYGQLTPPIAKIQAKHVFFQLTYRLKLNSFSL